MPSSPYSNTSLLFQTPEDLAAFDATPLVTGDQATVLRIASLNLSEDRRVIFTLVREDDTSIPDMCTVVSVGPSSLGEGRWRRSSGHLNVFKRVTTLDATPVDLDMGIFGPSQSQVTVVDVTAHDDLGQQTAFIVNGVPFSRYGTGLILVAGVPLPQSIPLTYAPNVAPWNTITADFTQDVDSRLFITVTGLAGVSIRWIANLEFRTIEVT